MTTELTITLIVAILGSGVVGGFLNNLMNRHKVLAEARALDVDSEVKVGSSWKEYAKQQHDDMERMRAQIQDMSERVSKLQAMVAEKDKTIDILTQILQGRNPELTTMIGQVTALLSRLDKKVVILRDDQHTDEIRA
jgi:phosphopantetheine adenylyltransferase